MRCLMRQLLCGLLCRRRWAFDTSVMRGLPDRLGVRFPSRSVAKGRRFPALRGGSFAARCRWPPDCFKFDRAAAWRRLNRSFRRNVLLPRFRSRWGGLHRVVANTTCIARTRRDAHVGTAMPEGIGRSCTEGTRFVAMDKAHLAHDLVGA